jgi:hypothetical protein
MTAGTLPDSAETHGSLRGIELKFGDGILASRFDAHVMPKLTDRDRHGINGMAVNTRVLGVGCDG